MGAPRAPQLSKRPAGIVWLMVAQKWAGSSVGGHPRGDRGNVELGEFLRSRRSRIAPRDVGIPVSTRRRVPGLRREELARLAGVRRAYCTRLAQGRPPT